MSSIPRLLALSPGRIAAGYLVFGVLWILVSDQVVFGITDSPTTTAQIQTVKGWVFVAGSTALIFALTRTRETQLTATKHRLRKATQELQVLHRVFRHNIRNDLNVVDGYLEKARETTQNPQIIDWLDSAVESTKRVLAMSEKLRVIDQTTPSITDSGTVEIVDVLRKELEVLESTHPRVTIETNLPDRAVVHGDHSLQYVFRELFENAMTHHHRPGDHRWLSISAERSLSSVTIQVTDNGPGISDDELAALTTETETPLTHVSGVGLWLVKWLCSSYGGTVRFDGAQTAGTTVTVQLPTATSVEDLTALIENGNRAIVRA